MKRILVAVVVLILAGAGGYYGWTQYFGQGTQRLDVQTAALQRGDVRSVISTSGTVKARVTVDVSVQVSGQVAARPVDYNSVVKKGDLLARIDPLPFETKIRQLDASISIAEASVAMANAGLEKATINAAKAASDLERNRMLAASGAVTRAALETADNADKLAKADLSSANAQLQNANAGLKQRKAEMETAQIDLDHTFIRAPIDGIVVDRLVEVGQTVAASSSAPKLFTLVQDLSSIDILAVVDEADVAHVASGNPVTFRVDAFPDATFSGDVWQVRLAPVTQQNVVTYTIIVHASNPGSRLLPGMTANLDMVTGERRNVLVVPNEALRFQPRGAAAALVKAATPGTAPAPRTPVNPAAPATSGGKDVVATLQRELNLDEATVTKIRAALRDQVAAARPAQGGAPPARAGGGAAAGSTAARGGAGGPVGGPVGGFAGGPGPIPGGGGAAPTGGGPVPPGGGPVPPGGGNPAATFAALGPDGGPLGPPADGQAAATARAAGGAAGGAAAAARLRTEQVLRDILTPEQFVKFQALQAEADAAPRNGVVWTREPDGALVQHTVQLGLASVNQTEIVGTDLAEGARIVLRVREVSR